MLSALSTCDPGDINAAIKAAKQHRVRVSGACAWPSGWPACCRQRGYCWDAGVEWQAHRNQASTPRTPPSTALHSCRLQWWGCLLRCTSADTWRSRRAARTLVSSGAGWAATRRALLPAPAAACRFCDVYLGRPPCGFTLAAVALNEGHLQELMLEHAVPPPAPPGSSAVSLVRRAAPRCMTLCRAVLAARRACSACSRASGRGTGVKVLCHAVPRCAMLRQAPPCHAASSPPQVRMGFPSKNPEAPGAAAFCSKPACCRGRVRTQPLAPPRIARCFAGARGAARCCPPRRPAHPGPACPTRPVCKQAPSASCSRGGTHVPSARPAWRSYPASATCAASRWRRPPTWLALTTTFSRSSPSKRWHSRSWRRQGCVRWGGRAGGDDGTALERAHAGSR